jgi:hypothetical protein
MSTVTDFLTQFHAENITAQINDNPERWLFPKHFYMLHYTEKDEIVIGECYERAIRMGAFVKIAVVEPGAAAQYRIIEKSQQFTLLYEFADHKHEMVSNESWYKYDKCEIYHILGNFCENFECGVCQKSGAQFTSRIGCGHEFCSKCIVTWFQHANLLKTATTCPMCRKETTLV